MNLKPKLKPFFQAKIQAKTLFWINPQTDPEGVDVYDPYRDGHKDGNKDA